MEGLNSMKFSEELFDEVKEIWDEYLKHPFVKGIGEGTLDKKKFKNYLIQDYLYLKDYAKTTDLKTLSDKAFAGINKNISSIGSINNEIDDMNKQYGSIIKVSGNNNYHF